MSHVLQRSHRHFVAVPLFLFAILLPVSLSMMPASLLRGEAVPEPKAVPSLSGTSVQVMPDGVRILLFEDAVLDTAGSIPVVQEGSVLIAAEGIARVAVAPSMEAVAFNGLFHVSRSGERVTVSALTAPVLIVQNGRKMLLPAGRLWRSDGTVLPSLAGGVELWLAARGTDAVPRSFFQEQLRGSALLPAVSDAWLPPARARAALVPFAALPRLPAAQQRLEQEQAQVALGLLRYAVEQQDGFAVSRLLEQTEYRAAFATDDAQRVIALFLARSAGFSPVALPLLTHLSSVSELWVLFSIHPGVNSVAWALTEPTLSKEDEVLVSFMLPEADFNLTAFDPVVLRRWSGRLAASSVALEDQQAFFALFLRHMDAVIARMDVSNYPERAERLVATAHEFIQPFLPILPSHSRDLVLAWERRGQVEILPIVVLREEQVAVPAKKAQEAHVPVAATPESQAQAEATAKELLTQAGALFTLQTHIAYEGGSVVRVRNLVFSTPLRDRTFDFLLDTQRGEVRALSEGAQAYPYAMPLQEFVAWASR